MEHRYTGELRLFTTLSVPGGQAMNFSTAATSDYGAMPYNVFQVYSQHRAHF